MSSSTDPDVGRTLDWRKSRHSMGNGNCVEAAADAEGIMIRDSVSDAGMVLRCSPGAWRTFLASVKEGKFARP